MTKKQLDELTYNVLGAAIEVHKTLGPGLLESVYHKCLKLELKQRNIQFQSECSVDVNYKGLELNVDLRCDFLVEDILVVELKSTDGIAPIFEAQLLTYMKLLEKPKGLLINFNCLNIFKDGQKTFVNDHFKKLQNDNHFY